MKFFVKDYYKFSEEKGRWVFSIYRNGKPVYVVKDKAAVKTIISKAEKYGYYVDRPGEIDITDRESFAFRRSCSKYLNKLNAEGKLIEVPPSADWELSDKKMRGTVISVGAGILAAAIGIGGLCASSTSKAPRQDFEGTDKSISIEGNINSEEAFNQIVAAEPSEESEYSKNDSLQKMLAETDSEYLSPDISNSWAITGKFNQDMIYGYLAKCGYNDAAICAVLANAEAESDFNPEATGDENTAHTAYGLFQWRGGRNNEKNEFIKKLRSTGARTKYANDFKGYISSKEARDKYGSSYCDRMKAYCEKAGWENVDDKTAFEVLDQTEYFVYSLKSYPNTRKALVSADNTLEGAREATKEVTIRYEVPENKHAKAEKRADSSKRFWDEYRNVSNLREQNSLKKMG